MFLGGCLCGEQLAMSSAPAHTTSDSLWPVRQQRAGSLLFSHDSGDNLTSNMLTVQTYQKTSTSVSSCLRVCPSETFGMQELRLGLVTGSSMRVSTHACLGCIFNRACLCWCTHRKLCKAPSKTLAEVPASPPKESASSSPSQVSTHYKQT